ncbi:MAG TPA: hypothetical protein VF504_03745, partial [Solirubrobacterales bacterium]
RACVEVAAGGVISSIRCDEGEFTGTIERILNRKVRAFNSSVDTQTDVSVEVFHLEPDAPQR